MPGSIAAGSSYVDLQTISINDDDWVELDEQFTLVINVTDPGRNINNVIPDPTTCQIDDNDGPARISIADANPNPVNEPGSGYTTVYFAVSMTEKVDHIVRVTVSVAAGGTATHGTNGDFQLMTSTVTFNPGQTHKSDAIEVRVYYDGESGESEETFRLALQLDEDGGRDVDFLDSIGEGTIRADP